MKQSLKQWRDVQTPDLDMNSLSPATIDPTGAPRAYKTFYNLSE